VNDGWSGPNAARAARRRVGRWVPLALGALVLAGCGKELTAGGLREGEVSAVATDAGPAAARRTIAGNDVAAAVAQGTIRFTAQVELVTLFGRTEPITAGPVAAQVPIGSTGRVLLGRDSVPEGDYAFVRVSFWSVAADVQGLPLGGGTVFSGTATVNLVPPLVQLVPIAVTVRPGVPVAVVLRLNSGAWLPLAQPLPGLPGSVVVDATAFDRAVEIAVE
jgi:hypothetical protein